MHLARKTDAPEPGSQAGPVAFHGRITVENAGEVRTTLRGALHAKRANLCVDLSDVSYIDTSGVATLMEAARTARRQGQQLVLAGLHDQPRVLLETTHLDHLFRMGDQEAGA
jgi:anti-sigma B factor antagonist